jgi:hypothetical protein
MFRSSYVIPSYALPAFTQWLTERQLGLTTRQTRGSEEHLEVEAPEGVLSILDAWVRQHGGRLRGDPR